MPSSVVGGEGNGVVTPKGDDGNEAGLDDDDDTQENCHNSCIRNERWKYLIRPSRVVSDHCTIRKSFTGPFEKLNRS